MSRVVDFYRGQATDTAGRLMEELWAWDDNNLEAVHDFIQWLFPLPEPSRFNSSAPLLTPADIAAFHDDARLRANLRKSFERIVSFLGLSLAASGEIVDGPNFAVRAPDVWSSPNHNWLRITRILRCLTLLGLEDEARALFHWLESAHRSRRFAFAADTFQYWTNAVKKEP